MSGVDYVSTLDNPALTITHDFNTTTGQRIDGGDLDLTKIETDINTDTPTIVGVSMTPRLVSPFGTTVKFDLSATGSVLNWTINWGDNTTDNTVFGGSTEEVSHTYPDTGSPHEYFPTVYAVSATDGQVYLASAAAETDAEVTVGAFTPASGENDYTLARNPDTDTDTLSMTNSVIGGRIRRRSLSASIRCSHFLARAATRSRLTLPTAIRWRH